MLLHIGDERGDQRFDGLPAVVEGFADLDQPPVAELQVDHLLDQSGGIGGELFHGLADGRHRQPLGPEPVDQLPAQLLLIGLERHLMAGHPHQRLLLNHHPFTE